MGSQALIVAQDNVFNRAVLEENGYYFTSAAEVRQYADTLSKNDETMRLSKANSLKIEQLYSWNKIIDDYESFFRLCHKQKKLSLTPTTTLQPTKLPG